jgi:cytosine/adenosine deaminase-related metal-dependent hydrolase
MPVDLVLWQARRAEAKEPLADIDIAGGHIVNITQPIVADAPAEELDGRPVIAGFIESHIHLPKKDTQPRAIAPMLFATIGALVFLRAHRG